MAIELASFPFARQGQVPADAETDEVMITAGEEYLVSLASDDRAYILIRNLTSGVVKYYYQSGNSLKGFTIKPFDSARIINRNNVYIMGTVNGKVCWDIAIG